MLAAGKGVRAHEGNGFHARVELDDPGTSNKREWSARRTSTPLQDSTIPLSRCALDLCTAGCVWMHVNLVVNCGLVLSVEAR
jgi:hypothetical protein